MLYRARRAVHKWFFDRATRRIEALPPLETDPDSAFAVLSQIRPGEIGMFLLALRSFARFLTPARVYVVGDGMEAAHWDRLRRQVPDLEAIPLQQVRTAPCPGGGTWERLLSILDLSRERYMIQLDSDTLTLDHPHEVEAAVRDNVCFTLGTPQGTRAIPVTQAAQWAADHATTQHVQIVTEQVLDRIEGAESLRYVRGCSGFAGFARGQVSRQDAERFSSQIERLIGPGKWAEWGSEQVTSNFLVANAPGAMILPPDRYPFYQPGVPLKGAALIHFIGAFRYTGGYYLRSAVRLLDELQGQNIA